MPVVAALVRAVVVGAILLASRAVVPPPRDAVESMGNGVGVLLLIAVVVALWSFVDACHLRPPVLAGTWALAAVLVVVATVVDQVVAGTAAGRHPSVLFGLAAFVAVPAVLGGLSGWTVRSVVSELREVAQRRRPPVDTEA